MKGSTPQRDKVASGAAGRHPPALLLSLIALLTVRASALGADFYVAPSGSPSGNGSVDRPWDLATALAHPAAVRPGDTIWLRGGTYVGHFASNLTGTSANPIVVRQYASERATIDRNTYDLNIALTINGSYTWYWGFEVTNSQTNRVGDSGGGIDVLGPGTKCINLIVHDVGSGIGSWTPATGAELYGNLIYYVGYDDVDRGHGHGIYVQNQTGAKRIVDNILFEQFGYGIHAYTEQGTLDNLYFEGNTSFDNGGLSRVSGFTTNFLVGASGTPATSCTSSTKVAQKPTLVGNFSYCPQPSCTGLNLGYSKGTCDATVKGNYLVSGGAFNLVNPFGTITIAGNTFYGSLEGFTPAENPGNTYYTERPTGVKIFLRPNLYEPGRATIVVYNWDGAASVDVDLTSVLTVGSRYEIRNAQDYFGPPVRTGTWTSGPVNVPMTGLSVSSPVGAIAPPATGPEFNVFVLSATIHTSRCDPAYGDLNQDGAVNYADLTILGDYLVGNITAGDPPFTAPLTRADLDLSGGVNAVDLVLLHNFVAGNLTCLPSP